MTAEPNVRLPAGWLELHHYLALGIEPVDALRGLIVATPVSVTLDAARRGPRPGGPRPPVRLPRLPVRLARLPSGRYAVRYDAVDVGPVRVRVEDASRVYAPRRLALEVADVDEIVARERSDTSPQALSRRMVRVWLWPGAAYPGTAWPGRGRTALRGRVLRGGRPVPWVRVRASLEATADQVGFAHGDEHGEFVLVVSLPADFVGRPPDPLPVTLALFEPVVPTSPASPASPTSPTSPTVPTLPTGTSGPALPPVDVVPVGVADPGRPDEVDGPAARGEPLPPVYRLAVAEGNSPLRADLPIGRVSSRAVFRLASP